MATSAFKSTSKRTPIGSSSKPEDAGSTNRAGILRRSRSLSRYSGRYPPSDPDTERHNGSFVNTARGAGFSEISLEDLASQLFLDKGEERGRERRRVPTTGVAGDASQRKGRSVSRPRENGSVNNLEGKDASECSSRRRRSVSVVRNRPIDSESDKDRSNSSSNHGKTKKFSEGNCGRTLLHKATAPNFQGGLRKSLSQVDLLQCHDGYSSYSSTLTDDEAHDACHKFGFERTISAVCSQKKSEHPIGEGLGTGLYEAMRKELRHAVEEIRTELEQVMVKKAPNLLLNGDSFQSNGSDVVHAIGKIRKTYTTKLEQSEKRKLDLLAELAVEEQRGLEISKIVKELLPEMKQTATPEKPSRTRKRSNDRTRVSRKLTEEAEKYLEDFLSNVEDTDFSSIDGERSDTSSTLGGSTNSKYPVTHLRKIESVPTPEKTVEMDRFVFPLSAWKTSKDDASLSCKNKEVLLESSNSLCDSLQEASAPFSNGHSTSSCVGSFSPNANEIYSIISGRCDKFAEGDSYGCQHVLTKQRGTSFNMTEYLNLRGAEDLLFERVRQRHRIDSGGLLLCLNGLEESLLKSLCCGI